MVKNSEKDAVVMVKKRTMINLMIILINYTMNKRKINKF